MDWFSTSSIFSSTGLTWTPATQAEIRPCMCAPSTTRKAALGSYSSGAQTKTLSTTQTRTPTRWRWLREIFGWPRLLKTTSQRMLVSNFIDLIQLNVGFYCPESQNKHCCTVHCNPLRLYAYVRPDAVLCFTLPNATCQPNNQRYTIVWIPVEVITISPTNWAELHRNLPT